MDEGFSTEVKRPVGIGEIRTLWAQGKITDRHAFLCADTVCRFPLKLAAIRPGSKVEPYLKTCDATTKCLNGLAAVGHHLDCDFGAEERAGERANEYERRVNNRLIRVKTGTKVGVTQRVPSRIEQPPIARFEAHGRERINHPRWGLWRIVNELQFWLGPDIANRILELGEPRTVFDVFRRISDLSDLDVAGLEKRPVRRTDGRDFSETRHIFFGTAQLRPAKDQMGRLFFDIPFDNGRDQRKVSLLLRESFRDFSGHLKRFDRMLADVGFNNTGPRQCIAFVLGTIAPVTNDLYMNLRLARTLEDVVILPHSAGRYARALSAYLDEEAARQAELRRQEHIAYERALQVQREAQRQAEAERVAAEQARQRELERLAAERARERELARDIAARQRQGEPRQQKTSEIRDISRASAPPSEKRSSDSPGTASGQIDAQPEGLLKKVLRAIFGS